MAARPLHMPLRQDNMVFPSRRSFAPTVLPVVCTLVACGGGGSAPPPPPPAPTISAQPVSQTVQTDGSATYSVTASGTGLSFQWTRNGAAIAGATGTSYATPAASWQDQGARFAVVVSNAGGSVTSSDATLTLAASAGQRAFEQLSLLPAGGAHALHWNLNLAGAQASGVNHLFSDRFELPQSPLTAGPQSSQQSQPVNLTARLSLPAPRPTRVLKDGVILVVPSTEGVSRIRYAGADVVVESLAADRVTTAFSSTRRDYTLVALAGLLSASPPELAHWYNSVFGNPAVLQPGASWSSGAAYLRFNAYARGDRHLVEDCGASTTGSEPSPCVIGSTLAQALAAGIAAADDGVTWRQADGDDVVLGGVKAWVARTPRSVNATLSGTVQHRLYFERSGNVYSGTVIKDGTTLFGSYWVSNPTGGTAAERLTLLPYHLRLNVEARTSVAAAVAL